MMTQGSKTDRKLQRDRDCERACNIGYLAALTCYALLILLGLMDISGFVEFLESMGQGWTQ